MNISKPLLIIGVLSLSSQIFATSIKINKSINSLETQHKEFKYEHYIRTNIIETQHKLIYELAVPNVKKEDITIKLKNNNKILLIKFDRKPQNGKYLQEEIKIGKSERDFILPYKIKKEDIDINLKEGLLKIEIDKSKKEKEKEYILKIS